MAEEYHLKNNTIKHLSSVAVVLHNPTMKKMNKQRRCNRSRQKPPPPEESVSQTSILDLPEGILTHILSFLPTTAAAQTSAVTPAWRYLWHSVPVLEFDMESFQQSRAIGRPVRDVRQLFAEMLSQSLLQRPRHFIIQKFKLTFGYREYCHIKRYVDCWLRYVIGAKAVELDLNFDEFYCRMDEIDREDEEDEESDEEDEILITHYEFHYSDLMNSSVAVLRLEGIDLSVLPTSPLSIKIHSLRELYLKENLCAAKVIKHLLAACVNLEIFSLDNVEFEEDWKVESRSLKHFIFKFLDLSGGGTKENLVEICAPNLESLSISDDYNGMYTLKGASSLVAADVDFPNRGWHDFACWTNLLSSLGCVEKLKIQNMWCLPDKKKKKPRSQSAKFQPVEEIFSETFMFHNLKHVELLTGYSEADILGLEMLLKKCPQLETMTLVNCYGSPRNKKKLTAMSVVFQMPRLRLVEMKEFQKTKNELFVVGLLKKHGVVLDKIVGYPLFKESDPFVL